MGAYNFLHFKGSEEAKRKTPISEIAVLTRLKDKHTEGCGRPRLDRRFRGVATRDLVNTPRATCTRSPSRTS